MAMLIRLSCMNRIDVGEDSTRFESFQPGFAQGRVPIELDNVPDRTRRATSNGTRRYSLAPSVLQECDSL